MWHNLQRSIAVARAALSEERAAPKITSRNREETEFLPAALEVMDMPASPAARMIAWSIMLFLVIALVWAFLGQADVVAVAQGRVMPQGRSKVIQPLEIGIVRAVHVKDGQSVKAGEKLIELDPTTSGAERTRLAADLMSVKLEAERLKAALSASAGSPAVLTAPPGADSALIAMHRNLLATTVDEHRAKLDFIDGEIARRRAELLASEATMHKLQRTVPLVRERTEVRANQTDQGYFPRIQLLELQQQLAEYEQELIILRHRVTEATAAIGSLERQRRQVDAERKKMLLSDLTEADRRASSLTQDLLRADQRLGQQTLAAPIDGVVQQLAVHTVGGVVTPAQPLMIIVPDLDTLEIEAQVLNKDVGFLQSGQLAEVKLEAFQFTKYGTIPGRVSSISRDAVQNEKLGFVYPVRVELERSAIDIEGRSINLAPGMAVTVEIKTESRRLIEYLLSPIQRYRQESLRER